MSDFLELNGLRFRYQEQGDKDAPLIITLHGGCGISDHKTDFGAYKPLTDRFRLFSFDQRGCGETSLVRPYTFAQFADDVEAIRQELVGDRKFILCGGSFGGMIALTYAIEYPDKLSHLILRGTAASNKQERDVYEIFKERMHKAPNASMEIVEKLISDKAIDDMDLRLAFFAVQPLYTETYDPNAAIERARTLSVHAETHNELFRNDNDYDVVDQLHKITCPTLVLVGEYDWMCPVPYAKEMADGVQNGELVVFEGCNHSVHVEANEKVVATVREFLNREPVAA